MIEPFRRHADDLWEWHADGAYSDVGATWPSPADRFGRPDFLAPPSSVYNQHRLDDMGISWR